MSLPLSSASGGDVETLSTAGAGTLSTLQSAGSGTLPVLQEIIVGPVELDELSDVTGAGAAPAGIYHLTKHVDGQWRPTRAYHLHEQTLPAAQWAMTYPDGMEPTSVHFTDSSGAPFMASWVRSTTMPRTLIATLSEPVSGYARIG